MIRWRSLVSTFSRPRGQEGQATDRDHTWSRTRTSWCLRQHERRSAQHLSNRLRLEQWRDKSKRPSSRKYFVQNITLTIVLPTFLSFQVSFASSCCSVLSAALWIGNGPPIRRRSSCSKVCRLHNNRKSKSHVGIIDLLITSSPASSSTLASSLLVLSRSCCGIYRSWQVRNRFQLIVTLVLFTLMTPVLIYRSWQIRTIFS